MHYLFNLYGNINTFFIEELIKKYICMNLQKYFLQGREIKYLLTYYSNNKQNIVKKLIYLKKLCLIFKNLKDKIMKNMVKIIFKSKQKIYQNK